MAKKRSSASFGEQPSAAHHGEEAVERLLRRAALRGAALRRQAMGRDRFWLEADAGAGIDDRRIFLGDRAVVAAEQGGELDEMRLTRIVARLLPERQAGRLGVEEKDHRSPLQSS